MDEVAVVPGKPSGTFILTGVVARVSQDPTAIVVVDKREWDKCGTVTCATRYLTINVPSTQAQAKKAATNAVYAVTLPKAGETVQIIGKWAKRPRGNWLLQVDKVTKGKTVIASRKGK